MCKENLFALRKQFPDAQLIKLAVENPSVLQLRKSIPSSACILYYKISKNYTTIVWSVLAKEVNYPDATDEAEWCGKSVLVKRRKEKELEIITKFKPFTVKGFIAQIECAASFTIQSIRTLDLCGKIDCELNEGFSFEQVITEIKLYAETFGV